MKPLLPLAILLLTACVHAQEFPSKPIHIIAPAAAGSGTDLTARVIGQQMGDILKTAVIVDNKVGTSVGVDYVVRSAADGYTLLLSTDATVAIQPHVMALGYNTLADLAPIGEVGNFPLFVLSAAGSGMKTIADVARVARANPKGLSYGMGGQGTGGHIVGETVRLALNVPMTAIAYPSASRAVNDLMGGYVELAFADTTSVAQVKAGKLQAIATASATRASCLPDVSTLSEQGVPFDLPYSYGLLAPARTPKAVIDKLNSALQAALRTAAVRNQQQQDCVSPPPADNRPEDFARRLRYHHEKWGAMIRTAGVKIS
ncbi:MAG: tripartite tricarboxylate transporter substrate binding protein [Pseudomonadota bacterium]